MKTSISLILFFLIFNSLAKGQAEPFIKLEAKCQCYYYKKSDQLAKREAKKAMRIYNKESSKSKPNTGRLFGGNEILISIDLDKDEILEIKRSKALKNYLRTMNEYEKEKFDDKVLSEVLTLCPNYF